MSHDSFIAKSEKWCDPENDDSETIISKDGLFCTWKTFTEEDASSKIKYLFSAWKFEWIKLRKQNVIGFEGHIYFTYETNRKRNNSCEIQTAIKLERSGQWVEKRIDMLMNIHRNLGESTSFKYSFFLTPIFGDSENCKLVETSRQLSSTDSILVVEDKKIPVNKVFLSCQSEFFNALFTSDFKEKNADEIPIKDVKYEDFVLLLSVIHPIPVPPTDVTAPKLLKLADQFMMPAVTCHVESYLLSSQLDLIEKFHLADKYNLKRLRESSTWTLETKRDIEKITRLEDYNSFSMETQNAILHRLLSII